MADCVLKVSVDTHGHFTYHGPKDVLGQVVVSNEKNITLWGVTGVSLTIELPGGSSSGEFVGFQAQEGSPPTKMAGWIGKQELENLGMVPTVPDPWPSSGATTGHKSLKFVLNIEKGNTVFYRLIVEVDGKTYHDEPKIYNDPDPPPYPPRE